MSDSYLQDQLAAVGDTYMRLAKDRPMFAQAMARRWGLIAEVEQRIAAGRHSTARCYKPAYEPEPAEPEPEPVP